MPSCVEEARNSAKRPPAGAADIVTPPPSTTVDTVLADFELFATTASDPMELVSSTADYDLHSPTFLPFAPTSDFTSILDILSTIPAPSNMDTLRQSFSNAWLDGKQSISLRARPDLLLPLWMVTVLDDACQAALRRGRWLDAYDWLSSGTFTGVAAELASKCLQRFAIIPWDETLPDQAGDAILRTRDLTVLLGEEWVNDEVVLGGCRWIHQQLGSARSSTNPRIVSSHLYEHLRRRFESKTPFASQKRTALEKNIATLAFSCLYIPTNIGNAHWTLVKIDLINRTIAYGDSLNHTAKLPPTQRQLLTKWLKFLLPTATFTHHILTMPHQHDHDSCGIIVMSVIARDLLDLPEWTQTLHEVFRLEWFLRLTEIYDLDGDGLLEDDYAEVCIPA